MHSHQDGSSLRQRYDAVLLDVDGTLVDSNDAHAAAWSDAFATHGRHHAAETIRPLIGKGGDKLLQEVAGLDSESDEGKAISEARTDIFKTRYLPTLAPTPGAAALVAWLIDSGLTIVVATSAKREELEALLDVCDAAGLADQATTSDDAERSKPDPDIIVAALAESGSTAERAVMIGDTPYDIDAARRAGVATIALRCGGWDDASLDGAIAIFDHPRQLLQRLNQAPREADGRKWSALVIATLGTALVAGAAAAIFGMRRSAQASPDANLASYLIDHLMGSDAALAVVARLAVSQRRTSDGVVFERLRRDFTEERQVVRSLLRQLGRSSMSPKRAVGQASGAMLQAVAGEAPGTLAYFRTLESLLVAVQGKRSLWRTLRSAELAVEEVERFAALEQQALDQWRDIDAVRQRQVPLVFRLAD